MKSLTMAANAGTLAAMMDASKCPHSYVRLSDGGWYCEDEDCRAAMAHVWSQPANRFFVALRDSAAAPSCNDERRSWVKELLIRAQEAGLFSP